MTIRKDEFERIAKKISRFYRHHGRGALFANLNRFNERLTPDLFRFEVRIPPPGNMLTVLLFSDGVQPAERLYQFGPLWSPPF
jgi:hypothetical protein